MQLWAVVLGDGELAKVLWEKCSDQVSHALLAISIARRLKESSVRPVLFVLLLFTDAFVH
jgi:hypothetical protein